MYLKTMDELRKAHQPPPHEERRVRIESDEDKKKLVVLFHDESIYNTNEGQPWMWGEDDHPALLPKTKGSGIMVSDFVEEHDGYLAFSPEEHPSGETKYSSIPQSTRVLFEYGADEEGYWTGDRFMSQAKTACDIAELKFNPEKHTIVFIFDQYSCHRKFNETALIAKNILVKDGCPQRVQVWAGRPQVMVNPDGSAKGLRTI